MRYHSYWPILLLVPLFLLPIAAGNSVTYERFESIYEINITHVVAHQTLRLRYDRVGYLLGGQNMGRLVDLVDAEFHSDDVQINWTYDGSNLKWKYDPPLKAGESLSYTRRLAVETQRDPEGFREFPLMEVIADNASLEFITRDVDIISTTVPLDLGNAYSGNISDDGHYVIYSSRYKLFDYSWQAHVLNSGSQGTNVRLNVSVPRDAGNQHVISGPREGLHTDYLGNRYVILEFDVPPGGDRFLEMDYRIVAESWRPGETIDTLLPTRNLDRFTHPSDRFWQYNDPRISEFATSAAAGREGGLDTVVALLEAISEKLEYETLDRRKGALWACENGRGSCMEYSDLFIASARYLGIPSLYITGVCGSGGVDDAGHAWAAANVPGVGWFGLDPTWPDARVVDSGRLILRYCDPEDIGVSLYHVGGDPSIDSWGEEWSFSELTTSEAMAILNVDERGIFVLFLLTSIFFWLAKISIFPRAGDPLLINTEIKVG
jgi:transglutaminase-like putative cysteine protease